MREANPGLKHRATQLVSMSEIRHGAQKKKAPHESGAKFGRSIVMGLPGRWQTRHPNAEPNRWFLS